MDKKIQPKKRKKKNTEAIPAPPDIHIGSGQASDDIRVLKNYVEILEKVNRGLRAYIAEMTIVFRFIETVSGVHAQEKITNLLFEVLKELCSYAAAALYLYDSSDKKLPPKLAASEDEPMIRQFRKDMEIDERILDWVFRQGSAVIIPESFRKQHSDEFKMWSYMIAPLSVDTEKIGYIELAFNRPQGTFTQQMFSILNVLLKHAAMILVNERIYDKECKTAQKYIELDMLKKDVVNTTTHEIKTPLTIIQAASILLESDRNIDEEGRRELLGKITSQCRRIDLIISELFETSQLEDHHPILKKEKVNLLELTANTLKDIPYDSSKIKFKIGIHDDAVAEADPSSLYKVIRNLIENAVKYSPDGGIVTIFSQDNRDYADWIIKDQGIGISDHEQEQIFDKFFRGGEGSTRRVGGIGLGLYIVKRNLELNKGTIRVESKIGDGTTFIISIPKPKTAT